MDEVHLTDLDNFNRNEKRDGYQHLQGTEHMVERRSCLPFVKYYTLKDGTLKNVQNCFMLGLPMDTWSN